MISYQFLQSSEKCFLLWKKDIFFLHSHIMFAASCHVNGIDILYIATAYVWLTWTSCPTHWAYKTKGLLTFSRRMSVVCAQTRSWSLKRPSVLYQPLFSVRENRLTYPTAWKTEPHISISETEREKEGACPHPVDINNTSNSSLISYILLNYRVHLCLKIAFMDLLFFVSLCVSVHLW